MKQLQKAIIDEFKSHFRGDVLLPGDAVYNEVRQIWNAMIDRKPSLIARCASLEDVIQAVKFARKHKFRIEAVFLLANTDSGLDPAPIPGDVEAEDPHVAAGHG